jgi:hypothetical protein
VTSSLHLFRRIQSSDPGKQVRQIINKEIKKKKKKKREREKKERRKCIRVSVANIKVVLHR